MGNRAFPVCDDVGWGALGRWLFLNLKNSLNPEQKKLYTEENVFVN